MELSLNRQEETFVDFLFKFYMFNYVDIEIHKGGNTLDLILTNDTSLIQNVRNEINVKFSDHHFVLCDINISYEIENQRKEVIQYLTKVLNFGWKKGTTEQ